jgi:hypothetical protein
LSALSNVLMKMAVRTWFILTSRDKACMRIRRSRDNYLALAQMVNASSGAFPIFVPRMPGVDEDMRNWSFFMILEHNKIVNRSISDIVQSLVRGEAPTGAGAIDPKKGVMPSPNAGEEQIADFRASVADHLDLIRDLGRLRGSLTKRHPLFGNFDAHRWHCMFSFHLIIHYRQARYVVQKATAQQGGGRGRP